MKRLLFSTFLTFVPSLCFACDPDSVAVRYVKAIEASDVTKMANFMAETIHYQDPTMAFFGEGPIDLKGRDDTVKFWRDSFQSAQVMEMNYTVQDCFVAGPITMVDLTLKITVAGASWGVKKDVIELGGRHLMSLKLEDNKVVHQVDYVEYNAITQQVNALQNKYGSTESP